MEAWEVIKALEEGKKLKRTIWSSSNSWIEKEGVTIKKRGEGWRYPNKPYKEIYYTLFAGGWIVVESEKNTVVADENGYK